MPGVRLLLVLIGLVVAGSVAPAQPAKPAALKLPDGTIVVFTKSPDDLNPVPDGVLLPAAEYKALQDQLDAARKARESAKPVAPSSCDIRGKVVARGDRLAALLTLTYTVRTAHALELVLVLEPLAHGEHVNRLVALVHLDGFPGRRRCEPRCREPEHDVAA